MKKLKLLATIIFAFISAAAIADDCHSLKTTAEIVDCLNKTLERETSEINRVYADLRKRLDDEQKKRAKSIQLAWIKFRDLDCDFSASGVSGGSAAPMVRLNCLIDRTRQRKKELSLIAYCEEGDLSCPSITAQHGSTPNSQAESTPQAGNAQTGGASFPSSISTGGGYSTGIGTIYTGPRGGRYYINSHGNKTYLSSRRR